MLKLMLYSYIFIVSNRGINEEKDREKERKIKTWRHIQL